MLREENRMRLFENKMLGWLFGTKREKVTGGWKKLDKEDWLKTIVFRRNTLNHEVS
jgi:hypothetical protein